MTADAFIVTGFYTPNYQAMTERLAAQLDELGVEHHFYAHSFDGGWDRQLMAKPLIAQRALDDHPDKAVVLMDVDCVARGSLTGIADFDADVGFHQRVKLTARRVNTWPSSRVIVFKQTPLARELLSTWAELCLQAAAQSDKRSVLNDEHFLGKALAATPYLRTSNLPPTFAAHEFDEAADHFALVHKSAHDSARHAWTFRKWLKQTRRRVVSRVTGKPYVEKKYGKQIE